MDKVSSQYKSTQINAYIFKNNHIDQLSFSTII